MPGEKMELRYLDLKNDICARIYEGVYKDGERIPSERQLALDYDVSRITVRKALELLEEEGIVKREVGNGTLVQLQNWGNETTLDMIALVAPSKNPFFANFIAEFQKTAWEHEALLLYVEIPERTSLEDCLYRLYQKNIKNAVVWPDDQRVDEEKLLRLRSIGMNFVFFDTDDAYPYADSVYLDNEDAVKKLIAHSKKAYEHYFYVGWDNLQISNVKKREDSFQALCPKGQIMRVPWRKDRKVHEEEMERMMAYVDKIKSGKVICSTGELGQQIAEYLYSRGNVGEIDISVIDDFEGSEKYELSVYKQDLAQTARCIYEELKAQAEDGKAWKARRRMVKGVFE